MGGRSFTRGIASAVTVLAANASVADAAATAVANSCFVEDKGILQLPAEKIDPNSDLTGTLITTAVGPLSEDKRRRAIELARERAEYLVQNNTVIGAFIALENQFAVTDSLQPYISEASEATD